MKKAGIAPAFLLLALSLVSCLSLVDRKALAREYAALGNGYYQLKQYDKALGFFTRAGELDPKLPLSSFDLAKTFAENGQNDKSLSLVEGLLKQEPRNTVYLGLKGYILQKTGKTDEAKKCFEAVLAVSPYSKDALFNLGLIDYAAKDYPKAFEEWDRLVTIDPKDAEATLFLAKAAFKADKAERGFQLIESYNALKPGELSGMRLAAEQRYARREYSLALQAYETLVEKDPNSAADWFELSMLAMQAAEDRARSLEAFKKAFDLGFKDRKRAEDFIASLAEADRAEYQKLLPKESSVTPNPSPSASPAPSPSP